MSKTMYNAIVNSPSTRLANAISDTDMTITVDDITKLPPAPNLATIGVGETAETIRYIDVDEFTNTLTAERGFQGIAQSWPSGTQVARFYTAYDHDTFKENIEELKQHTGNISNLDTIEKTSLVSAINELLTKIGNTDSLTTDEKSNLVEAVNEIKQTVTNHMAHDMPHKFTDSTTGETYKWGLGMENGLVYMAYEEVIE